MLRAEGMASTEWQIGKTKVFLRSCVHEPLEEKRRQVLRLNKKHFKGIVYNGS